MDAETLKAIQIIALDAVETGSYAAFIRKTQRWYSREFSTPLADVESIPDEILLSTYYEDFLTELCDPNDPKAAEQYGRIRDQIIKTETDIESDEQDDEAWVKQMQEEVARDAAKPIASTPTEAPPEPAVEDPDLPNIKERVVTAEDSFEPEVDLD